MFTLTASLSSNMPNCVIYVAIDNLLSLSLSLSLSRSLSLSFYPSILLISLVFEQYDVNIHDYIFLVVIVLATPDKKMNGSKPS